MDDEYIKRKDVMEALFAPEMCYTPVQVKIVKGLPAADVAEVRLGQWEMYTDEHGKHARCSVCRDKFACLVTNNTITYYRPNYCPTCGARMDGGDRDAKSV